MGLNFANSTSISGFVSDLWRYTASHQGNTVLTGNWERPDTNSGGFVGGGRAGGSGVVILKVQTTTHQSSGQTNGSPTASTSGNFTFLTYNGSGAYNT